MNAPLETKRGTGSHPKKEPPFKDYQDEVTDIHYERIDDLVDQKQFDDAEEVCAPGW